MYAPYFGLSAEPFNLAPNPNLLYLGKQYREAMNALRYGLADRRGFLTLIGEVGTGKTTILYQLLSELPEGVEAAFVSYADQPFASMLSLLLNDLRIPHDPQSEASMLTTLNGYLRQREAENRTVAFIIDEAQNLDDATLERLRLLSNIETAERKLLQIVLVGQPELQRRLHAPQLRQLNERISVRAYLNPLPQRELLAYVTHRLQRVGGRLDRLVTLPARSLLLLRARGLPRRANILFHNALLFAYGRKATQATLGTAIAAIREMNDRPVRRVWQSFLRSPQPALAAAAGLLLAALIGREIFQAPSVPTPTALVTVGTPEANARTTTPPAAPVAAPAQDPPSTAKANTTVADDQPKPGVAKATDAPAAGSAPQVVGPVPPPTPRPIGEGDGETVLLWVPRGTTLNALAQRLYGRMPNETERTAFFDAVRRLNPEVQDPNRIFANSMLRVPLVKTAAAGSTKQP